MISMKLDTIK